jgi:hypothetical protein
MEHMKKVSGVWLKPEVVADEAAAADIALDGLRRRGVLAKKPDGTLVVCSRKTAKKHGWALEGSFTGSKPRTPKVNKKAERLAKLNAVQERDPQDAAKEQWGKIAKKASPKAKAALKEQLGLDDILGS